MVGFGSNYSLLVNDTAVTARQLLCIGDDCRDEWPIDVTDTGAVFGDGTADFIPLWIEESILGDSIMYQGSGIIGVIGDLEFTGTLQNGSVPWARLIDHPSIIAGTGLTGGGDLSESRTLDLTDTGVLSGSYGGEIVIPVFTVDAQGRLTFVTNQTIRPATLTQTGIVQLENATDSDSVTTAATPASVRAAYDLAASKTSPGTCSSGFAVQNTTTGGVECVAIPPAVDLDDYYNKTEVDDTFVPYVGATQDVNLGEQSLFVNGSVGIGTITPSYPLHILGNFGFSGTLQEGIIPWIRLTDYPTITAGVGLTGGGDLSENRTFDLTDTDVSAGSYGGDIVIPTFVVDAQGRLTFVTNQTIRQSTLSETGIVQLENATDSDSVTTAATPASVRAAYDLAASKTSPGTCSSGFAVQNTTTGGVECVAIPPAVDLDDYYNKTEVDDTFVPYVGATQDVNLGEQSLFVNGSVGIGTDTPEATLTIRDGTILAVGTTGSTPVSGSGTRMMWIPEKAAFRAGEVIGSKWDSSNIGNRSFAVGYNTEATGQRSFASGDGTVAGGATSTAMGSGTQATGFISTALGFNTQASGYMSAALGISAFASGSESMAFGKWVSATQSNSIVVGQGESFADRLVNNIPSSLMVGFNSQTPSLIVNQTSVIAVNELCIGEDCRDAWPEDGGIVFDEDDCIEFPNGGKVCGSGTCTRMYSPNGNTVMEACD
ncbi:MAG: tail fiber protein, partial [Candidatus Woesearchaeota archaeon]